MIAPNRLLAVLLVGTAAVTAHGTYRALAAGEAEVAATAALVTWLALFAAYAFSKGDTTDGGVA